MYLLGTHFKPGTEQGIKETEFLPFLKGFSRGEAGMKHENSVT